MRKFINSLLFFLCFSFLFYCVSLYFLGRYASQNLKPNLNYILGYAGHTFSRLNEAKLARNVDVLFLGSSHAYRGFDTRIFSKNGYKSFNLGSSSQTPIQTEVLLNRYLDSLNPKTIIYEVYPETFMLDGVESGLDIVSNDKNDFSSLLMALKINNIKVYNTFLFAVINDILNINYKFEEEKIHGIDYYISGGFVEKNINYFVPRSISKHEISFIKNQLSSFFKIISKIKSKKINLVLVYAPVSKEKYYSFTNRNFFDKTIEKNQVYYDFNKIMSLNDTLNFYDPDHLNQSGVELFNIKLIEILQSSNLDGNIK